MSYIFGIPLYIWGGIAALISLVLTAFYGMNTGKYGMKKHKIFAYITLALVLGHALYGIWMYFF
ncbi:MAG: hypothetical protein ABII64_05195 [Elusimicrobiota bacterium]